MVSSGAWYCCAGLAAEAVTQCDWTNSRLTACLTTGRIAHVIGNSARVIGDSAHVIGKGRCLPLRWRQSAENAFIVKGAALAPCVPEASHYVTGRARRALLSREHINSYSLTKADAM